MAKPLFVVQPAAPAAPATPAPRRTVRRQRRHSADFHVQSTPQLEANIDRLCELWGTTDRQAVFNRLFDEQLKRCFHDMAGLKQQPRLIVDNTRPNGRER